MTFLMVAWIGLGAVLAAMVLLLLVETVASLLPRRARDANGPCPSFVVLVPAHDEELLIGATVRAARWELGASGAILVVADNCSDRTAAEARAAGADVLERHDPTRRGKAHALAHGLAHLEANDPPEVVIMLDADCKCDAGAFERLARTAVARKRPVQALFLMAAPAGAGVRVRMAAFAWAFKNRVRAGGLARLGLPCHLSGSGMAFPWATLKLVSWETSSIVEDLQQGLRYAQARHAPVLCEDAVIHSSFPTSTAGLQTQRRRWEHGHLETIATLAPALLWRSVRSANGALAALVLDMCVPPLALLCMLVVAHACISGVLLAVGGAGWVAMASLGVAAALFVVVLLAWVLVGREWLRLGELLAGPGYILRKLPLYAGFLLQRQARWDRTERGP